MLEEHVRNNDSRSESEDELIDNFTGIPVVEDLMILLNRKGVILSDPSTVYKTKTSHQTIGNGLHQIPQMPCYYGTDGCSWNPSTVCRSKGIGIQTVAFWSQDSRV